MSEKKKIVEGTDFLNKLQNALKTGDKNDGSEVINRINVLANKINPLKDNLNPSEALSNEIFQGDKIISRNYDESSKEKPISIESRKERFTLKSEIESAKPKQKTVTIESEKENLRILEKEEKLAMINYINNAEHSLSCLYIEMKEIQLEFEKNIELQESEISILKIKYEAKYDEKHNGKR